MNEHITGFSWGRGYDKHDSVPKCVYSLEQPTHVFYYKALHGMDHPSSRLPYILYMALSENRVQYHSTLVIYYNCPY